MRALFLLFAIGCGPDVDPDHHQHPIDAAPHDVAKVPDAIAGPDADFGFCDSAPGSSHVTVVDQGVTTVYDRLHVYIEAGGGGPVAPFAQFVPISMMFTSVGRLGDNDTANCLGGATNLCPAPGVRAYGTLENSGPGEHPMTFEALTHADFSAQGSITITHFLLPTGSNVGHVMGSVATTTGTDSVTGTFENDICLVSVPI